MPSIELSEKFKNSTQFNYALLDGVAEAYKTACEDALVQAAEVERELVVVVCSFHTAAAARIR